MWLFTSYKNDFRGAYDMQIMIRCIKKYARKKLLKHEITKDNHSLHLWVLFEGEPHCRNV